MPIRAPTERSQCACGHTVLRAGRRAGVVAAGGVHTDVARCRPSLWVGALGALSRGVPARAIRGRGRCGGARRSAWGGLARAAKAGVLHRHACKVLFGRWRTWCLAESSLRERSIGGLAAHRGHGCRPAMAGRTCTGVCGGCGLVLLRRRAPCGRAVRRAQGEGCVEGGRVCVGNGRAFGADAPPAV